MTKHLRPFSLFLLLAQSACLEPIEDRKDDTADSTPLQYTIHCEANLTVSFPNGEETALDFCAKATMDANYEFDPDTPPEIRTPILEFSAVEDEGFECEIVIAEPSACGTGYYRIDGSSGSVNFITLDCSGAPDDYEGEYTANSGWLRFDHMYAGDEPGNFTGEPLLTSISGHIDVGSPSGIQVSGDFSLGREISAVDAEQVDCRVSDGDEDDDGQIDDYYDGQDCNDNNASVYDGAEEIVANGVDDDCDGNEACYQDVDRDGYGTNTIIQSTHDLLCSTSGGHSA